MFPPMKHFVDYMDCTLRSVFQKIIFDYCVNELFKIVCSKEYRSRFIPKRLLVIQKAIIDNLEAFFPKKINYLTLHYE